MIHSLEIASQRTDTSQKVHLNASTAARGNVLLNVLEMYVTLLIVVIVGGAAAAVADTE